MQALFCESLEKFFAHVSGHKKRTSVVWMLLWDSARNICNQPSARLLGHIKRSAMRFFSEKKWTGNVLLSQAASHQVSSALRSLTTVFEMGTGVTSPLLSPDLFFQVSLYLQNWIVFIMYLPSKTTGQVFDLLVSVSWICHHTYTSDLSTW